MKIVVAIDSFKGSLSSMQAGLAVKEGILRVFPEAQIHVSPVADGGEGTVEALTLGMGGISEQVEVTGPLGGMVTCVYGRIPEKKMAIIEMAGAAGLTLVPKGKRNPLYTTTFGVGEVIEDAIKKGCRHIIVGIGGSATNDGGVGMLQALGYEMCDQDGKQIPFGAKGLEKLHKIENENVLPELKECTFHVACDVKNPLCGKQGCSHVFAEQKGATLEMIEEMDKWLLKYSELTMQYNEKSSADLPGSGAAGGLGFAFLSYLKARLESGIQIVLKETKLEEAIKEADIVVTGEGKLDGQTIYGKAPVGIAAIAKKYGKPVIAFAGTVTKEARMCNDYGIDAYFPILQKIETLEEAMQISNAEENMRDTAEQVFRMIQKIISYHTK